MEWCEGVKYDGPDKRQYRKARWCWEDLFGEAEQEYITKYICFDQILDQNNIYFGGSNCL